MKMPLRELIEWIKTVGEINEEENRNAKQT